MLRVRAHGRGREVERGRLLDRTVSSTMRMNSCYFCLCRIEMKANRFNSKRNGCYRATSNVVTYFLCNENCKRFDVPVCVWSQSLLNPMFVIFLFFLYFNDATHLNGCRCVCKLHLEIHSLWLGAREVYPRVYWCVWIWNGYTSEHIVEMWTTSAMSTTHERGTSKARLTQIEKKVLYTPHSINGCCSSSRLRIARYGSG